MIDCSKKHKPLLRFEFQSSHVIVNRNKFALKNKLHQLHVMQWFFITSSCDVTCTWILCHYLSCDAYSFSYCLHKLSINRYKIKLLVRIINNVPLRDHITPYYVNLDLIELPSIVKLHTCQPLYEHLINEKPLNYTLSLVSEQHNYATWSASLQQLNPCFSRINIKKFCPTVTGCYYWNDLPLSVYRTWQKKALYQYYFVQY